MRIDEVKDKCTGCGGCTVVCPTNAIVMIEDEEGFEVPYINEEKCINCGKCYNKCHAVSANTQSIKLQEAYYGRAKDKEVLNRKQFRWYLLSNC